MHTAPNFLGKLCRVVFSETLHKTFENDPFGTFGNSLRGVKYLNSVFPELALIDGAIILVSRKAVRLINDNGLEFLFLGVLDKLLKLRPLVRSS